MKKSELRKIIKEEIQNVLKERFDIKKMDLASFKKWEGDTYRIEDFNDTMTLIKVPRQLSYTQIEKIVKKGFGPNMSIEPATPDDISKANQYPGLWRIS